MLYINTRLFYVIRIATIPSSSNTVIIRSDWKTAYFMHTAKINVNSYFLLSVVFLQSQFETNHIGIMCCAIHTLCLYIKCWNKDCETQSTTHHIHIFSFYKFHFGIQIGYLQTSATGGEYCNHWSHKHLGTIFDNQL